MKVLVVLLAVFGCALTFGVIPSGSPTGSEMLARAQAQEEVVAYYSNGSKKSVLNYADGQRSGPGVYWHKSGIKAAEGRFEGGQRQGRWIFWGADGQVDAERSGLYVDGKRRTADVSAGAVGN